MRVCSFLLVLFLALPLVAQSKHPFTFEDMMALKRVEEPEVSPDGKWVLFAAVDVDLKANTRTPHVWVVPLNQPTAGSSTPVGMTGPAIAPENARALETERRGTQQTSPLAQKVGGTDGHQRSFGSSTSRSPSPR